MRLLLLHLSVVGICGVGLVNPLFALYGYVWYSLMRPDSLAWSEGMYPHSFTIAIVTVVGVWRYIHHFQHWIKNPFVLSLLALQVPIAISVAMAIDPALSVRPYYSFLKVMMMCLMIPLFVQTEETFKRLILLSVACLGFIGFKFGVFGLRNGGIRLETGYGGFISDNNTLAMALVMALPMIWHARGLVEQKWIRVLMFGVSFLTIVAIIMSHSRAAALTLVLVYLCIAAQSKYKIVSLAVIVLLSMPALYLVKDTFITRMRTLEHVEDEGSAAARIAYAKAALKVWADYPMWGVGFGTNNWVRMSGPYLGHANVSRHVIHNNYLQMAVDSGTLAFFLLCAQLLGTIWWLGRSAKRMRKLFPGSRRELYPIMIRHALIAFSFCSIFLSRTDYDLYYYLIMYAGCWYIVERTELLPSLSKANPHGQQLAEAVTGGGGVATCRPVAVIGPARTLREADPQLTGPIPKGWRRPFTSARLGREDTKPNQLDNF